MNNFRAELHLHTVLSPCADIEMIPPLIIQAALDAGINLLAVTDHNQTANIQAVINAARDTEVSVLAGMEVQTGEDIHLLCLFDTYDQARLLQSVVDAHLPNIKNNPDFFGEQFIVDHTGDYLGTEERLLINAVGLSTKKLVATTHEIGGLAIAAHVDRKAYGLLPVLGIFPEDIPFDAIELSRYGSISEIMSNPTFPVGTPVIRNGDVHRLSEFLGGITFMIETCTVTEIKKAFLQQDGRKYLIQPN